MFFNFGFRNSIHKCREINNWKTEWMVFWKALWLGKKKFFFWLIILQRLIQELPGHLRQWLIKLGDSVHHPWYPCPSAAAAGTENNQPSNPVNEYTVRQPIDYKNTLFFLLFQASYKRMCGSRFLEEGWKFWNFRTWETWFPPWFLSHFPWFLSHFLKMVQNCSDLVMSF